MMMVLNYLAKSQSTQLILIMSIPALNNLTKIKDIKSSPGKITSEYRLSSAPIAPKNKRIVKTFTFTQKISKPDLLKHQIELTKEIPSIHPVTQLHIEDTKEGQRLLMIEEYLPNGDLTEYIDAKWKLDIDILTRIALAIGYLHYRNIYHLNLKPENILLDAKDTFKFTDQRLPYLHSLIRKSKQNVVKSPYIPPQADGPFLGEGEWDVWSLGIIFMELALHRRIHYDETKSQNLAFLMRQIQDEGLRHVINGMLCQKDLRFTISEVITCLKQDKSLSKGEMDNKNYFHIRLNLFSSEFVEKLSPPVNQQTISVKVDSWMFSFTLMHLQSNHKALWITANSNSNRKTSINIMFSSLPPHIQSYFVDWQTFFKELKTKNPQDFKLDKEGYLTIKMKMHPPSIKQPQPIAEQTKQSKQSFANPSKISMKQPHLQQKTETQAKNNSSQMSRELPPHPQQIQQPQADDDQLIFGSDCEEDILVAYISFPKTHSTISEIAQRLEIMTKVQKPDIDLISMSYEQMGGFFYDQSDFSHAKKAYKLARQGYISLYNKESIKEMNLLIELGNTYYKLGELQKSIRCFRESAFIAQQKNDEGVMAIAYKNWASVALHLKDDQTAEKYFLKCVEIYSKKPDSTQQLMGVYSNLSNIYLKRQEYTKSNECIEIYIRLNQNKKEDRMGVLNFNLGFGLLHLNQFKLAFQAIRQSLGEKYKQSIRTEMEKILIGALRKKKQQIKNELSIHKESIAFLRKLLQSSTQKTLDTLLA